MRKDVTALPDPFEQRVNNIGMVRDGKGPGVIDRVLAGLATDWINRQIAQTLIGWIVLERGFELKWS